MRNGKAEIYESFDGKVRIFYKGREQEYRIIERPIKQLEEKSSKTLNNFVDKIIREQDEKDCAKQKNTTHQKVIRGCGSDEPCRTF